MDTYLRAAFQEVTEHFIEHEHLPAGSDEVVEIKRVWYRLDVFQHEEGMITQLAQLHQQVVDRENGLIAQASIVDS